MGQSVVVAGRELVIVGRINSPIGIKGRVKLAPVFFDTQELESLLALYPDDVYVLKGKNFPKKLLVSNINSDNKFVRVDLFDIRTRDQAEDLNGAMLAVLSDKYTKYINDTKSIFRYIGYMISDVNYGDIGILRSLSRQGQILFDVVKNDGTDVLIPFADALVKNIDEDKKNILMDLPEGLL